MTKWTNEQMEAIYKDNTNIIVSAGAGSGKTAVLTERVLEKVKKGVSLKNLLILTFTKMAAKEMRERIGDKLKEASLYEEVSLLDSADITTFDAYSLSLVKKYYYYLGVSKNVSIIDSSVITLYKRKCLNDIFLELYEKEDEKFLNLIRTYSVKNDKEIFEFILMLNSKFDLKLNKEDILKNYLNTYFNNDKIDNDIDKYVCYLSGLINDIKEYFEYIDDDKYLSKLYDCFSSLFDSYNYDEISRSIDIKMPRIPNGSSDVLVEYKNKIKLKLDEIKSLCRYDTRADIKNMILAEKEYIDVIINILLELDRRVMMYKREYDYYEYSDIAFLAIKLVRDNVLIRNEIRDNLNEILIDEYQDTNDIQEEFISYISNNNVYMVGDIKQSIYRFRNANPYIFKNKYDNYSKNNGGIKIDLNKNFRSREEVIDDINLIFERIMSDNIGGAAYLDSHKMIFGNMMYKGNGDNGQNNNREVYTYIPSTFYKKEEVEAYIIANDINKKIRNNYLVFGRDVNGNRSCKYSDFVILMDSSKHFDLYKKILEYNNIPCTIMKKGNLIDGVIISIIANILKFVIKINNAEYDTEFKRLFMSIGRSFLFGIDDNTLFNYFINNNFYDSDVFKKSKIIADNIDNIPLEDIIDIVLNEFDFYNKLILIGDIKDNILKIDKLKDITKSLVGINYSIYEYIEYLNDIISNKLKIEYEINDINSNSVKIMTIHASKGLEFSICYFSSLYSKFKTDEATAKFTYDNEYGIIIPYKNDFMYNTIYHDLSYLSFVRENISERIRLFYVALTRAKEKMIFILPENKSEGNYNGSMIVDDVIRCKYNSFASIFYSLEPMIKSFYRSISLEDINLSRDYNLIKDSNVNMKIDSTTDVIVVDEIKTENDIVNNKSFSKKNKTIIDNTLQNKLNYGKYVHELLEFTDFSNDNIDYLSDNDKKIVSKFLEKVSIVGNETIYKEYEFVYDKDNCIYHGIIDLMIEYDDYIKIIDYKLKDINDISYLEQLHGYKEYIEKKFNKRVYTYLYSIYLDELKEI